MARVNNSLPTIGAAVDFYLIFNDVSEFHRTDEVFEPDAAPVLAAADLLSLPSTVEGMPYVIVRIKP